MAVVSKEKLVVVPSYASKVPNEGRRAINWALI